MSAGFDTLRGMRIALALLVVMVVASPVAAQAPSRAEAVVGALGVDEVTAHKLIDLLVAHDQEVGKLQKKRSEYRRQLVSAHHLDPKAVDRLLDDAMTNQRALADAELRLIARVRQLVPSPKAVQLLFLLSVTDAATPGAADDPGVPTYARGGYDRDPLAPPRVVGRTTCDPFASMHGCRD